MKKGRNVQVNRDTKDVMTLVFLFSLIIGIALTTYLASHTLGGTTTVQTQAAGPH